MRKSKKNWGLAGMFIAGIALLGGLGGLLVSFVLPHLAGPEQAPAALMMAVGSLLIGIFASIWLVIGWRVWRETPGLTFPANTRDWVILLGLWLLLATLGLLLPERLQLTTPFALIHLAVVLLPAWLFLIFAGLAAGRGSLPSFTQLVSAMSGGLAATLPAFLLEMIGLLLIVLLVGGLATLFPGGQAELAELQAILQRWFQSQATSLPEQELLILLGSPLVLAVLLLILTLVAPLIEEFTKVWVVIVLCYRRQLSLAEAFLLGAASGLGFAILEGALNSIIGLGERWEWAAGVGMRLPATAMHALTSGLIGLGWGYFWQRTHRWLLPTAYLSALCIHGLWNFSTVGLVASSAWLTQGTLALPGGFVSLVSGGMLLLLIILAPLGLFGIPFWLRSRN
ncbi:MAG: PrsW family glutamic-type intramembrane protease [Chloroflexota bacterium]|nr:PrsW family glutamic-type intramembrane protease [Chloroflexota bacterium]